MNTNGENEGTDVAIECADVVVMGTGLQGVAGAMDLAKTTYRRMRLNMLWALLYNSLAIPLASGLFFPLTHSSLPPMLAGFAMVPIIIIFNFFSHVFCPSFSYFFF